jgi:hypothetical protein
LVSVIRFNTDHINTSAKNLAEILTYNERRVVTENINPTQKASLVLK